MDEHAVTQDGEPYLTRVSALVQALGVILPSETDGYRLADYGGTVGHTHKF